jgi:hypothetical protein
MRLACRQLPNRLFRKRWTPSNEICLLADKARLSALNQQGENRTFASLATGINAEQYLNARPLAVSFFINTKPLA